MASVTIADVAARAGVSTATVSKALRGLPVSPANLERVQRAAEELGWQPNPHASSLASGRAGTLGLVVAFFGLWYDAEIIAGVEAAAAAEGYDLLVWITQSLHAATPGQTSLQRLGRRVDGLVLADFETGAAEGIDGVGVPAVAVGGVFAPFPSLTIDDHGAARTAVEHLLDLGHERIALVAGPLTPTGMARATEQRRSAYDDALEAAGIAPDPALVEPGGFTVEGGRDATNALLDRPRPPTAVFCLSDEMAFGAYIAARDRGLSIPGDLSLVGFGDHPMSPALGLTTMRQPLAEMTEQGVAFLLDAIAGKPHEGTRYLDVTLETRTSTAPPA